MSAKTKVEPERAPAASLIEISRVMEETARLVRQHADAQLRPPAPADAGADFRIDAPLVRAILRIRQLRADYFPSAAGDPAWTMILELFAAALEGRRVNQSSLAKAAGVPHTTALRTVRGLLDRGVLVDRSGPDRGRELFLGLSDTAAESVSAYLTIALATVPYIA